LPWSGELIGYNRDTVKIYLSHFYHHWTGRKEAVHPLELEEVINVYSRPGAFQSSIQYYRARAAARTKEAAANPKSVRIDIPVSILWGEEDPVMLSAWSDRLFDYFADMSLRLLPEVGHFVPLEAPEELIAEIQKKIVFE
jgi:pimeloyl-ACP methyl ester carboxylesterase